jgi:hypothetical protein
MTRYTKKDLDREARLAVKMRKSETSKQYRHCIKLNRWELVLGTQGATLAVIIDTHGGRIQDNIAI